MKDDNIDDLLMSLEKLNIPKANPTTLNKTKNTNNNHIYQPTYTESPTRDDRSRKSMIEDLLRAIDESDIEEMAYVKPKPSNNYSMLNNMAGKTVDLDTRTILSSIQSTISINPGNEQYNDMNFDFTKDEDEFMNQILDEDKFLKEIEIQAEREKLVCTALKEIIEENLKLPKPTTQYNKKSTPHEIVNENISKMQELKRKEVDGVPMAMKLRVKANADFDPKTQYTEEEAKTMLYFKKNMELVLLSVFTPDWMIGYVELKATGNKEMETVKIFPITLVMLVYTTMPKPLRMYDIKFWDTFGIRESEFNEQLSKQKKLDVAIRSMEMSHLFKGTEAKPKVIHQAIRDFNTVKSRKFVIDDIPLLSFKRGDLIVVTKLPNQSDWAEGYIINKADVKLGIFPNSFTTVIKLKLK